MKTLKKDKEMDLDLKHTNRKWSTIKCPACEKQYLSWIKQLEAQNKALTEMLRMKHLVEPILIPDITSQLAQAKKEGAEEERQRISGIMDTVLGYIGDEEEQKCAINRWKALSQFK